MKPQVTVVDYGLGNILSVTRALEFCGAEVRVTDSALDIQNAERLVLPGVGAFADGMQGLRERSLIAPLIAYAQSGRPMLGICLGMQMLLERAEEFGNHEGLGIIPGTVTAIPSTTAAGLPHKIPHIGWNELKPVRGQDVSAWTGTVMEGMSPEASVYFVHSFAAMPSDELYRLADAEYHGRVIPSVLRSGNVYGCQFHPEKSGEIGMSILRNFLRIESI